MNERQRGAEQSLKTSPEDEIPRVHDLTGAWIIIMTFVLSADGPWSPRHLKRLFVGIYGVDCGGIGWQAMQAGIEAVSKRLVRILPAHNQATETERKRAKILWYALG